MARCVQDGTGEHGDSETGFQYCCGLHVQTVQVQIQAHFVVGCVRDGAGGTGERGDCGPGVWGCRGRALHLVPERGLREHILVDLPIHPAANVQLPGIWEWHRAH
jgi:hypothetical protein